MGDSVPPRAWCRTRGTFAGLADHPSRAAFSQVRKHLDGIGMA
jgi:hypothetical protein